MRTHLIATKADRHWQGIPGIERAPNGRLWCVFFSGGTIEPHPENTVYLTTSTDDGFTWAEPWPIVVPVAGWRAFDENLWIDPQGRMWLFYNRSMEGQGAYCEAIVADNPNDAELRWSAPRRIALGVPFAFRLNKPIVLLNGDWMLPVTYTRQTPPGYFGTDEHLQGVALSSDRGESWRLHGALEAPSWALENMELELRDGSVWMLIRTNDGVLWQSRSTDGGHTWVAAHPSEIVNPGSRFFLRRLRSGKVLLINSSHPTNRQELTAYLSDGSDGAPFEHALLLDSRDKVSYPDAVQAPDGTIYAVHDYDRYGPGEIVLNVFTEEEITTPVN